MMERMILHIDGDDFFAAVARRERPEWNGRALIIGNLRSRGSVVAASTEARRAGVRRGQNMNLAKRLCPEAELVQVNWEQVARVSREVEGILERYSPLVERSGAGSWFLDYTGCGGLFGPAPAFSRRLQRDICGELQLSVSIGISAVKAVSAVASRAAKPGWIFEVDPGKEAAFLAICPLEWLPGIDAGLCGYFRRLGVRAIGDLAAIPVEVLQFLLGGRGILLWRRARAEAVEPVRRRRRDRRCVAMTFPGDTARWNDLDAALADLSGRLGAQLRGSLRSARYITLQLTYTDGVISRRRAALKPPTHRDPEILRSARAALRHLYSRRIRVRGLALEAAGLVYRPPELPVGDAARRLKWDRALAAVDKIRRRYPGDPGNIQLAEILKRSRTPQSHVSPA